MLEQHHVKKGRKRAPLISYVIGKQKYLLKPDLLDHYGTYCVINDCKVREGMSVANLNAKEKSFFFSINSRGNKIIQQNKVINYSSDTYRVRTKFLDKI